MYMKEVEKIISEVVASFRIDNINVPPEVIYDSVKRLETIFSKNSNKSKLLVKRGTKNV